MNMISKAISLYAQRQGDEDEQSDDKEQEEDDEEECMQVDKAVACLKKERRQLISKECPHVTQCKKEVIQLWNQYLDCLDRGSPLYAATAEFKPAEQNIGRIEKFNKYSELSKAKRKKAETATTLRLAFDSWENQNRKTSRAAAKRKTERLDYEMNKYNEDSYHDKNKALDHIAKPSKLVAAAALSSKDKQHQLGAMNREDDDTATELAVSNYNSAFNYNIGRLAGDCSRHTNPKVRKLLKDTAKSVGIDSANELPEDEHPSVEQQDAPEQDGQGEDIPVEEVWEDEDTTSIVEGVDIVHMRHYLMMMVSGPILFEQQFRKEIEANGGELVCPKCREFLPEGTWTIFSKVSNLGKHMRNAHTDWKDLKYKMACGPNKFKCPGACDSSQTFGSVSDVREHCLSPECVDQQAFLDMKKSHDLAEKLRLESRRDEFARDRTEHPRNRRKIRARQIRYLSTLDRGDILELADEFKIPHHEVEPYADKMLAITRFIGDMLL